MNYRIVTVTSLAQNATLLWCETTHRAVIVDPGGDLETILEQVDKVGARLDKILLTHGHIDHAGGAGKLSSQLDIPIEGPHIEDQFWIEALPAQSQMFGFPSVQPFTPERWLRQGDRVRFGDQELEVLHCPGHTPGHLVFFHPSSRLALVGDVLFKGSVGRTDFPKGDQETLIRSIRNRLLPLGDDVDFVPGHGPMSTLGRERVSNPYLAG